MMKFAFFKKGKAISKSSENIMGCLGHKIFILLISLMLSACASLQHLIPIEELGPKDVEPKVSFIEEKKLKVKATEIDLVAPEKVIASYQRLLNRGDSAIRQEALHRLADLKMRLAEAKIGVSEDSAMSPAVREASFAESIALYQTLLNESPNYAAIDEVKYQLARAHSLNSDPDSSLAILDTLAVVHQESLSYVESQFRRGEAYFSQKKYQTAEQAYGQVITKGINTTYYNKALYKRGWSLFKQGLFGEAQKDFFVLYDRLVESSETYQRQLRVYEKAQKDQAALVASQDSLNNKTSQQQKIKKPDPIAGKLALDLISDTRRVISLSFYNQEGAESARDYFATFGRKPYENDIYGSLADLYIQQERFQDAADTYSGFIERNPLSLSAPDFHTRMIQVYHKGGFPSLILPAKESFVVNYGRNSEFWNKYTGIVIDELKPLLRQHLDDISKFYHAKAQASKKPEDYREAAKWYRVILATFSDPQIDSQYRFALAESLFEGGLWAQAAKEFEQVAYQNEPSQYSRDAGYRALLAYQNQPYPKQATELERYLPSIQSGLKFSQVFASDLKAPEILARVAEQQLIIKDLQAAINSSQALLVLPAKVTAKQKNRAKIIIASGLFDLKRYAEAEVAIGDLLKTGQLSKKERTDFRNRRVEAVYQLAEAAKSESRASDAIALFLKVKALEPNSAVAINAHFDAASLLLQGEKWSQAAKLLVSFRKSHAKHQLTQNIPEMLALAYEKQEDWSNAAAEYHNMSSNQSDPNTAREGFWRVAELYEKAGNRTKAIKAYKHYVHTYASPYLLAQEGRSKLVTLYLKAKDAAKASFWDQKIVQAYAANKAQNNQRTAYLAAASRYRLSEDLWLAYKSIKLTLPLAKTLKKKRAAMKKALAAYNSVAQYQVAFYTSASTHRVAQIYQMLSDDLLNSQRPKGLGEDELEEYGYLLEDQALPFEDKAINFYEVNAKRTMDAIYTEGVKSSIDALRKLKPAHYDKHERLEAIDELEF